MDRERLLELAGVEQVTEGKTFQSAEDMLSFVVYKLHQIRDDNLHPDVEAEDILNDINDLVDSLETSKVK